MDVTQYSPIKPLTVGNVLGFAAAVILVVWAAKKLPFVKTLV